VVEGTGQVTASASFSGLRHRSDAVVPLAVALAATPGTWLLADIGALRIKESDRLESLARNLVAAGFDATALPDALEIRGRDPRRLSTPAIPPVIDPLGDHRIAMAFAVLATVRPGGLRVLDPGCAAKSWPGFFDVLRRVVPGCGVQEVAA
jgi:3-phosphoshikimate 1-carboxyvinyltransferase